MFHHRLISSLSMCLFAFSASAENTVPMMSGGVGEDERAALEAEEINHNLKLVFTGERGMYLSDVSVVITDKANNIIVDTLTEGPIMLVKLPAGSYNMETGIASFQKKMPVRVGNKLRTINISFPVKDAPPEFHHYQKDSTAQNMDASPETPTPSSFTDETDMPEMPSISGSPLSAPKE